MRSADMFVTSPPSEAEGLDRALELAENGLWKARFTAERVGGAELCSARKSTEDRARLRLRAIVEELFGLDIDSIKFAFAREEFAAALAPVVGELAVCRMLDNFMLL